MTSPTNGQPAADDGRPASVVDMPHAELIKNYERLHDFIPNDVVKLAFDDDMSAVKPWRMPLELTQADIA